jgi:hypothetical protein
MLKVLRNISLLLALVIVFASCSKDSDLFNSHCPNEQEVEDKDLVTDTDETLDNSGNSEAADDDDTIDTDGDGITDDEDDEDDDDGSSK